MTANPRRRRRFVRTSLSVLAALAVIAGAGAAATGVLGGRAPDPAPTAAPRPTTTATVRRTTLTSSQTVAGTLGYGDPTVVQAPPKPAAAGDAAPPAPAEVLTQLPTEGAVIQRGEAVYSVDEQKVPLLYGNLPLYRTITTGDAGNDVAMLEQNLNALGYGGFTVDDTFTAGTAAAVQVWQADLGRPQTGVVQPGDAVVAPGARRVAEVKATLGGAVAGDLLTWTGTERVVTVDLDTQYEDLVKEGATATVTLPDGTKADATVSTVGTAATPQPSPNGASADAGDATLPVTLSVADQAKLGRFQAAPVDVTLTAATHQNVLAVPVNALIARPSGGYAVQAVTAHGVEDRPVELGLFANGLVEVSGAGITEGLEVGVPR